MAEAELEHSLLEGKQVTWRIRQALKVFVRYACSRDASYRYSKLFRLSFGFTDGLLTVPPDFERGLIFEGKSSN